MSKVAVVYWSGTGNTKMMAEAVLNGAKNAGADASIYETAEFSSEMVGNFDAIAFGCPAMGAEVLEESEFQPLWDSVESSISNKKIALFGSYGWGDGEWLRNWEASATAAGAILASESVMCNDAPDDDSIVSCEALGAALV